MKGGHEESALIAILLITVMGLADIFVDAADQHPAKIIGYFGLFFILYLIARVFRGRRWR